MIVKIQCLKTRLTYVTWSMTLSRSSGAVLVRDTAPATPPASRWLHDTPNTLPFRLGKSGGHVSCSPMSIIYSSPTTYTSSLCSSNLHFWSYFKLVQITTLLISIAKELPWSRTDFLTSSSSAIAEWPRDALSQLKSCQLLHNCTKNHIWLDGLPFDVV